MYCPKCGTENHDNNYQCTQCGEILHATSAPPAPQTELRAAPAPAPIQPVAPVTLPNYLWQSIVVTIFCCWPLGIPAIVYSAQVNSKVAKGDIEGARASSKNAKMWCWIALGTGLVIGLLYIILMAMGVVSNMHVGG